MSEKSENKNKLFRTNSQRKRTKSKTKKKSKSRTEKFFKKGLFGFKYRGEKANKVTGELTQAEKEKLQKSQTLLVPEYEEEEKSVSSNGDGNHYKIEIHGEMSDLMPESPALGSPLAIDTPPNTPPQTPRKTENPARSAKKSKSKKSKSKRKKSKPSEKVKQSQENGAPQKKSQDNGDPTQNEKDETPVEGQQVDQQHQQEEEEEESPTVVTPELTADDLEDSDEDSDENSEDDGEQNVVPVDGAGDATPQTEPEEEEEEKGDEPPAKTETKEKDAHDDQDENTTHIHRRGDETDVNSEASSPSSSDDTSEKKTSDANKKSSTQQSKTSSGAPVTQSGEEEEQVEEFVFGDSRPDRRAAHYNSILEEMDNQRVLCDFMKKKSKKLMLSTHVWQKRLWALDKNKLTGYKRKNPTAVGVEIPLWKVTRIIKYDKKHDGCRFDIVTGDDQTFSILTNSPEMCAKWVETLTDLVRPCVEDKFAFYL